MTSLPAPSATPATLFTIGAKVNATDGPGGTITRVIVDPIRRTLTHIVVESHHETVGRLVPRELVASSTADQVELTCTLEAFNRLERSRELDYFPRDGDFGSYYGGFARGYGYGAQEASFWPYYGYGGYGYGYGWRDTAMTYDAIPAGEVTIRRGDPVSAVDGEIGTIAGLVIGTPDGSVSHVLLQEGHLWGKHDVSIPIASVSRINDVVQVAMTRHEIEQLPAVDIDHPETVAD